MRNWFEVGVRERQNDATKLQERGTASPKLLPIKLIAIKCSSLSISEVHRYREKLQEREKRGKHFGLNLCKRKRYYLRIFELLKVQRSRNCSGSHCCSYVARSFLWAGFYPPTLHIFHSCSLCI